MKTQIGFFFSIPVLVGLCLLVVTGCMQPVDGDFGGAAHGLKDQELLWVLQLTNDSSVIKERNTAFFRDAAPVLVRDVINGNLPVYEDYAMHTELQPVRNISERLRQFGGSKQDVSPLSQVVELICLVDLVSGRGPGKPEFLRLIWRDPAGLQADRSFAGIRLADIEKGNYAVGGVDLAAWLRGGAWDFQPVYLRTNARAYTIQTPAEAAYLKKRIVDGKWATIDWVEDGVNISGKQKKALSPDKTLSFNGLYIFSAVDSTKNTSELYLTAEKDYLIADWSSRFRMEKIMSFGDSAFFSHAGDLYFFSYSPDSILSVQVIQGNDTLNGIRQAD